MGGKISFCNDCDFMTRTGFEEVHFFFRSLNLLCGDSFWLFDPSGGDMALFTHDTEHFGPQHHWLLDQINEGVLDVLHSVGSYGKNFNRGFRPQRNQIAKALNYLERHAKVPRIWTNHGDDQNTQNIGGYLPLAHHCGDRPDSSEYCLDLLLDHGVKYFWHDRLVYRDSKLPIRLTAEEICRDGHKITTFIRFLSPNITWSPNAQNMSDQLNFSDLRHFSENRQLMVYYTHWGCHHKGNFAMSPVGNTLDDSNRKAVARFAENAKETGIEIVRLPELLDSANAISIEAEIQRIGEAVTRADKNKADSFYYNQYGKHGLDYFRRRIKGMGVRGNRALDAGCGVGQWSYALKEHFGDVKGIEQSPTAITYLKQIENGLRVSDNSVIPEFSQGSVEKLPYKDGYFDFILCYGVLFCTHIRQSLDEFSRVLAPGGRAYICINGDGWYEYLVNERFKDQPTDFQLPYTEPIWNALVMRTGGVDAFNRTCLDNFDRLSSNFWEQPDLIRAKFINQFKSEFIDLSQLLAEYSDRVILLLGKLTQRHLEFVENPTQGHPVQRWFFNIKRVMRMQPSKLDLDLVFPMTGIGSQNRAFLPGEFSEFVKMSDMIMEAYGADGDLCRDKSVFPIYQGLYNNHESVWECLVSKQ